jgi:hypothetical protein
VVLVQVAFALQFAVFAVHSLMSTQDLPFPLGSVYPVPHWHRGPFWPTTQVALGSQPSV